MSIDRIIYEVSKRSPRAQELFIELLRDALTPEEVRSLQIGIAVSRVYEDKELKAAMVSAMGKYLYEMFNKEE